MKLRRLERKECQVFEHLLQVKNHLNSRKKKDRLDVKRIRAVMDTWGGSKQLYTFMWKFLRSVPSD